MDSIHGVDPSSSLLCLFRSIVALSIAQISFFFRLQIGSAVGSVLIFDIFESVWRTLETLEVGVLCLGLCTLGFDPWRRSGELSCLPITNGLIRMEEVRCRTLQRHRRLTSCCRLLLLCRLHRRHRLRTLHLSSRFPSDFGSF